jgi:Flp pilus assembly protein protease CpaA
VLLTLAFGAAGVVLAFVAMPADALRPTGAVRLGAAALVGLGLAAAAGYFEGDTPEAAFVAGVSPLFVAIAAVDIATRRIPNRAVVVGSAAALSASVWGPADGYVFALLGGLVGLALGIVAFVGGRGHAFGAGDAKLAGLIGITAGLRMVLPALLYGTFAGGVAAVIILLARRRNLTFAYGPYLAFGTIVALFVGLRT